MSLLTLKCFELHSTPVPVIGWPTCPVGIFSVKQKGHLDQMSKTGEHGILIKAVASDGNPKRTQTSYILAKGINPNPCPPTTLAMVSLIENLFPNLDVIHDRVTVTFNGHTFYYPRKTWDVSNFRQ